MSCPICGSDNTKLYIKNTEDYRYQIEGYFDYLKCNECTTIFLDIPFINNKNLISKFYPKNYETHNKIEFDGNKNKNIISKILIKYSIYLSKSQKKKKIIPKIYYKKIGSYNSWLENPKHILDIGCGSGYFLKKMKFHGIDVTGLDPDINVASNSSSDLKIVSGFIEDWPFEKSMNFDSITMHHVIEHSVNPVNDLKILKEKNQKFQLTITTPNTNSFLFKYFKKHHWHLDPPRHLVLFNKKSAKKLLENAGYTNFKIFTINRSLNGCLKYSLGIKNDGDAYSAKNFNLIINIVIKIMIVLFDVFGVQGDEIVIKAYHE